MIKQRKLISIDFLALIIFFTGSLFLNQVCLAQDQEIADSLKFKINTETDVSDEERMSLLTDYLNNEQNNDSVIHYGHKLLSLALSTNVSGEIYSGYYSLAGAYQFKGDLEKSLNYYIESLKYAGTPQREAASYSNLANVYYTNMDYNKAFKNYLKALGIFEAINDSLRYGTTAISLGYNYFVVDRLDSAYYYTNSARNIYTTLNYKYRDYYWAYAEGNIALIKAKQGNIQEAENSLNQALEILIRYNDDYAICDYRFQLSKIYFERGELDTGLKNAIEAYKMAEKNRFKIFIKDGAEILSQFYAVLGNYENAYKYQSTFITYKDSLLNVDLVRKLADQQKEFEVGQKQADLDLVKAEQEVERVLLWSIGGFALILIVLAIIIFQYYRSKSKVNRILEEQKLKLESLNDTKDKFFSIISHDLRGPISSFFGISRMIKFFVKSKETDQLLEVADDIDQSVQQLTNLLDNLLSWAVQQQGEFPNNPASIHLQDIANEIVSIFSNMSKAKNITLSANVERELFVYIDKQMLETVIRNLVNNALKFTPETGAVTILGHQEGEEAHIQIKDTGVGIAEEKLATLFNLQSKKSTYGTAGEKGLGLGLQLAYEFVATSNGRLEVESSAGNGTVFHLYLPIANPV